MPVSPPLPRRQAAARLALAALLLAPALSARAQAAQGAAPASVSGRVTSAGEERGVPGVAILLVSTEPAQRFRSVARAKTDHEGRYSLTNVPPGRYQIMPHAPAHVVQGLGDNFPPGRPLTLLAGDDVRDLDFRVERGGVITGRVTDADGNPLVGEQVTVEPVVTEAQARFTAGSLRPSLDPRDMTTDDRGVYRVYGLPPGRYRVSVGRAGEGGGVPVSIGRRKLFRRTYHPDTTEAAQARVLEVKSGDVAEDVDISMGRPLKTYRASGVFVSAETGRPVPNVPFGYGSLDQAGRRSNSFSTGQTTNARGEFQTEGLAPGRYSVFNDSAMDSNSTELYAEPAPFEIADADVSGIVVKLKRGASVSGVVQIEGVSDRAALARMLSQVRIYGWVETAGQMAPPNTMRAPAPAPDGSFRLGGLRAGKIRLSFNAGEATKGLSLARVELNGAHVPAGFDVKEGEQVTGVRIVLAYGTGVITGQTNFVGGPLPPGARVIAVARRPGNPAPGEFGRTVEADARGFFRIEGLPAGEYEVTVRVFGQGRVHRSEPQTVSLAEGGEARVAPVVDLTKQ